MRKADRGFWGGAGLEHNSRTDSGRNRFHVGPAQKCKNCRGRQPLAIPTIWTKGMGAFPVLAEERCDWLRGLLSAAAARCTCPKRGPTRSTRLSHRAPSTPAPGHPYPRQGSGPRWSSKTRPESSGLPNACQCQAGVNSGVTDLPTAPQRRQCSNCDTAGHVCTVRKYMDR